MDSVHKFPRPPVIGAIAAVHLSEAMLWEAGVKPRYNFERMPAKLPTLVEIVNNLRVIAHPLDKLRITPLSIKILLRLFDILLQVATIVKFFFNLFNRMNGGRVIFTAKLMSNFREGQLKFTS